MAGLNNRAVANGGLDDRHGAAVRFCHGGVAAGTRILTLDGNLPVEFLEPGDRIITRSGARKLRALEVRVSDGESAMRVSAGALGFDRPDGDVLIGADQTVLVRDWRAKAMFGQAQATVPITALADGTFIAAQKVSGVRFYTLVFDTAEVVYADGMEIATAPMPALA
jgi:hypothetical protein